MNAKIKKIVDNNELAKSAKIRQLSAIGVSRSEIAKLLGIRYQFVRNVLVRNELKIAKNTKEVVE